VVDPKPRLKPRNIQLIRNLLYGKRHQSFKYEPNAQGEIDATLSHTAIMYDNGGRFKGYGLSLKT